MDLTCILDSPKAGVGRQEVSRAGMANDNMIRALQSAALLPFIVFKYLLFATEDWIHHGCLDSIVVL